MIIYNTRGEPININPDSPPIPTFKDVASNPDLGLRTVERKVVVNGYRHTFYDTYLGDKLIEIQ